MPGVTACILKVGFLNEHEDELLPQYEAKFDMVLLGDQGMEEVQTIIGAVLHETATKL